MELNGVVSGYPTSTKIFRGLTSCQRTPWIWGVTPIVSCNRLGYSELEDNILPHKLDDILVFDGGESFNFYPFSKIVDVNQQ